MIKNENEISIPKLANLNLNAVKANIKYKNRYDLALFYFNKPVSIAGVFTKSTTAAISVIRNRKCLSLSDAPKASAILVNSGNANAFSGNEGEKSQNQIISNLANALSQKYKQNVNEDDIYICSTGVIGEPLDPKPIYNCMEELTNGLSTDSWDKVSRAIMTTDLTQKITSKTLNIFSKEITINGIAKGSGMIAPNMATMLGFIFTDATIQPNLLQTLLNECNEESFNSITVDGDTSTNDTVFLCAMGDNSISESISSKNQPEYQLFKMALKEVMVNLAKKIAKDGEGASKLVEINIKGAPDYKQAKLIGMAIANSPLVKTAIAGEDPNWGRLIMAIGKTEIELDLSKLSISLGEVNIVKDGAHNPNYQEVEAASYMKNDELNVIIDLGLGNISRRFWTCDFTKKYIEINADYRS